VDALAYGERKNDRGRRMKAILNKKKVELQRHPLKNIFCDQNKIYTFIRKFHLDNSILILYSIYAFMTYVCKKDR